MPNEVKPEVAETQQLVAKVQTEVAAVKIATNEEFKAAGETLKMIKAAQKRVEALRTNITGPLNEAL